ncbi:outer membrane protein OmpA [Minicystis rosea]|nr:outer membrane protein OmpA [Minicystis rosea]
MLGPLPRLAPASIFLALGLMVSTAAADAPVAEATPPSVRPPPPDPIIVELMLRGGFNYRIGSGPSLPVDGRAGGAFGLGAAIAPWKRAAISLSWERIGLGDEHGVGDLADARVSRSLDVIWAGIRLYLARSENFGLHLQLGPGLAFQHASADVLLFPSVGMQPSVYRCRESGGPGLALRAGLGGEAHIVGPIWFTADALVDNVQASSNPLGDCAPGMGSTPSFGMRLGLSYRIDVSRAMR